MNSGNHLYTKQRPLLRTEGRRKCATVDCITMLSSYNRNTLCKSCLSKPPAPATGSPPKDSSSAHKVFSMREIADACAEVFKVTFEDLLADASRGMVNRNASFARQFAMLLCQRILKLSTQEIGELFGGRDRPTVTAAIATAAGRYVDNAEFRNKANAAIAKLGVPVRV